MSQFSPKPPIASSCDNWEKGERVRIILWLEVGSSPYMCVTFALISVEYIAGLAVANLGF